MEYTANTTQQNAIGELKFTHLAAKARAAMNAAKRPRNKRWELFPEVVSTMTKLDWLNVAKINGIAKTRIEHYGLLIPRFIDSFATSGAHMRQLINRAS